jgi:copper ion binding protein
MKAKSLVWGFLVFSLLCLFFISQTKALEMVKNKTIKIKCTEMTCAGCKKKITQSINNLEGIKKVKVDLETKMITVTFDESKTSPDKIVGAIAEAGYESEIAE